MSDTATMLEPVINVNTEAYRVGFAAGYMKAKAEMAAKPKPQRTTTAADRKLNQDIAKAMSALNALERWKPDRYDTPISAAALQEAIQSEMLRLQCAIQNPALLWRIYRRNDKGPSYVEVSE